MATAGRPGPARRVPRTGPSLGSFALDEGPRGGAARPARTQPHFLVLGDADGGKMGLFRLLARGLAEHHPPDRVQLVPIDYRRTSIDLAEDPHLTGYACNARMATEVVDRLARAAGPAPAPGSR